MDKDWIRATTASGIAVTDTPAPSRVEANASRTPAGDHGPVPRSGSRRNRAGRIASAAMMGAQRNHHPGRFRIRGTAANTRAVRRIAIAFWYRSPRMADLAVSIVCAVRKDLLHGDTCRLGRRDQYFRPSLPTAPGFIAPSPSNRGEDFIALVADAIVVPEVRVETRPALTTLVPTLDRILGPFEPGKITLIDSGSDFVFHLTTLLAVRAVMEGHEVVFLDGGNSVDL